MNPISLDTVITRTMDLVTANMDGETVMMSLATGKYYNLGKTGSVIWDMLSCAMPVEAVISGLLQKYQVEFEQCQSEVLAFLEDMRKQGLIEVV